MNRLGGHGFAVRIARLIALGAGALALANCSGGLGKIDPKYGVAASPRVVEPGEPVPKGGGFYRVGKPYTVSGRTYVPETDPDYSAVGLASWYGPDFHGRYTANGEIFDMNAITAAHPTLPLPSYVRVTNLGNHRSIVVRVNDRGPYAHNRIIDLSYKTAKLLGMYGRGVAKVKVEYVGRAPLAGSDDRMLMATLREGAPAPVKPVLVAAAKPLARTYFDARPMSGIPSPPPRPYGTGMQQVAALNLPAAGRAPTTELAAASHPLEQVATSSLALPRSSPVSAYAPVRYDGHAADLLSGRGLY
jgi:rare lipoprotein A